MDPQFPNASTCSKANLSCIFRTKKSALYAKVYHTATADCNGEERRQQHANGKQMHLSEDEGIAYIPNFFAGKKWYEAKMFGTSQVQVEFHRAQRWKYDAKLVDLKVYQLHA